MGNVFRTKEEQQKQDSLKKLEEAEPESQNEKKTMRHIAEDGMIIMDADGNKTEPSVAYKIYAEEKTDGGYKKQLQQWIVVTKCEGELTKSDKETILKKCYEKAKDAGNYNAFALYLFSSEQEVKKATTNDFSMHTARLLQFPDQDYMISMN